MEKVFRADGWGCFTSRCGGIHRRRKIEAMAARLARREGRMRHEHRLAVIVPEPIAPPPEPVYLTGT